MALAIGAAHLTALAGPPQMGTITRPARALRAKVANTLGHGRSAVLVRDVIVHVEKGSHSVEVQIKGSGPLTPVAAVLSTPERIAIDLPNARCDRSRRIPVHAGDVENVSVETSQEDPPATRVELELSRPHKYQLLSSGKIATVRIDPGVYQPESPNASADAVAQPTVEAPTLEPAAAKVADLPTPAPPQFQEMTWPAEVPPAETPQPPYKTPPGQDAQSEPLKASPAQIATLTAPASATPETASRDWDEVETTAHQLAKGERPGIVRNISLSRGKDATEVHIESDQKLHPAVTALPNPERIVIDLPDMALHRPLNIKVNAGGVRDVVASVYLVNPLVTRVVVNLDRSHGYEVRESGRMLTVRIEAAVVETRTQP